MTSAIGRRDLLLGLSALGGVAWFPLPGAAAAPKLEQLTLYGPPAGPSVALTRVAASNALGDYAEATDFEVCRNPDQLRAGITSGRMPVTVSPTHVAVNLYNRGAGFRLLNVMTWGLLHVVTRRSDLSTFEDLRGATVLIPFRNDMPDLVFRHIADRSGLAIGQDIVLEYVSSPTEAMQLLLSGRYDSAWHSIPRLC